MIQAIKFWAAVGVQLAILAGMVASREVTLLYGRTVVLQTVPVDPRSLFSGDYVRLRYGISNPNSLKPLDGKPPARRGETLYVLFRERNGDWEPLGYQRSWPAGREEPFMRGTVSGVTIEYGIETYYVPEGQGREIEEAIRRPLRSHPRSEARSRVRVEVRVGWSGNAVIRRLIVDGNPLSY